MLKEGNRFEKLFTEEPWPFVKLTHAIQRMKTNKGADESGRVAELLQAARTTPFRTCYI